MITDRFIRFTLCQMTTHMTNLRAGYVFHPFGLTGAIYRPHWQICGLYERPPDLFFATLGVFPMRTHSLQRRIASLAAASIAVSLVAAFSPTPAQAAPVAFTCSPNF